MQNPRPRAAARHPHLGVLPRLAQMARYPALEIAALLAGVAALLVLLVPLIPLLLRVVHLPLQKLQVVSLSPLPVDLFQSLEVGPEMGCLEQGMVAARSRQD